MTLQGIKQHSYRLELDGLLTRMINRIRQSLELQEILDAAVVEVRSFLQTDRVKIYRFCSDGHGEVIAECRNGEHLPSLLGLHFPTDDIPGEARKAFRQCRQRVIVDVATQQTCLRSLNDAETGALLAVEDVRYRPVDPCHVQYLKAMGVTSSLVVPILHQDLLWGLLVSHHSRPHDFVEDELQVVQLVADQIEIAIAHAILLSQTRNKAQREATVNQIAESLHRLTAVDIQQALEDTVAAFGASSGRIYHVNASGDNQPNLYVCGKQPTLPSVFQETLIEQHILWKEYFRPVFGQYTTPIAYPVKDLYTEPRLRVLAPSFAGTAIRGILVVVLEYREQFLGYLTLFRCEVDIEMVWAGQFDPDERQVQPRNSFAAWKEYKRHQAVEWSPDEIKLAQALAKHFAIAMYEYELYQQLHQENLQRIEVEQTLRRRVEEDQLCTGILQRIRYSLNLETILDTTVAEVRQFLQTDRVLIYQFQPDWSGVVVAESVSSLDLSIFGQIIDDPCFVAEQLYLKYQNGHIAQIEDIETAPIRSCYLEMLQSLHVRANLVVPILMTYKDESELNVSEAASLSISACSTKPVLWGLLLAHNCMTSRQWQSWEVLFLQQLAVQVAIALQQSALYQQVRQLNVDLEQQVQERTAELQQSLTYEALLKRITDKVRDSLDKDQILQTAVQELAIGLNVVCCDSALYDPLQQTSTISYEYLHSSIEAAIGQTVRMRDRSEIYDSLLAGRPVQFCFLEPIETVPRNLEKRYAIFACPITDNHGVLGDLWLFKSRSDFFTDLEIRLIQQVANQCAIALRQAYLYQASQAQVQELARLNLLKDDFLSTVSHELRTPMSSIKLATQMLEVLLKETGLLEDTSNKAAQYFQILNYECKREINLINDLLDLTRLDARSEPLILTEIHPTIWISYIAEAFHERVLNQKQQLQVQVPSDFPSICTDVSYLERIISELLNNACKYTPPEGLITVAVTLLEPQMSASPRELELLDTIASSPLSHIQICVSNTGVEIPPQERDRIFDKFYRIPNNDPWKHGGTGLGLALVKKLTEYLGGTVRVESEAGQTSFILQLPTFPVDETARAGKIEFYV